MKILTIIALLVLIVGCGNGTTNNTVQTTHASTLIKQSGPALDIDSLHIQLEAGVGCPLGSASLRIPANHLVLATSRFTYDRGELQQMIGYLKALYLTDETIFSIQNLKVPLPVSLRWAAGGWYQTYQRAEFPGCTANLQITNVGSSTIQIPQVGVRLTQSPQQNNYQYRLIDSCTLLSLAECECHACGAGPSFCETYYAEIHMGIGEKNSVFAAAPAAFSGAINDQGTVVPCGELTLKPNQTTDLIIDFYSLSPPNSHLSYSVVPEITLVTSSGKKVLTLTQLGNSVVFANQSQFSCYGLQGHTFVMEKFVIGPGNESGQSNQNCI